MAATALSEDLSSDQLYGDDATHPIPSVTTLDTHELFDNGSSELSIIVRGPLGGDKRSQSRLIQKIDNYLALIESEDFAENCGPPSPERTRILVNIPYNSDEVVFVLLDRCQDWVRSAGASLVVERIMWRG